MSYEQTIKDAQADSKEQTVKPNPEGTQKQGSEETKTDETSQPVYVSGIDVSDLSVEDRAKLTPYLEKKAKLLEDGYQGKFKEVAKFKKAQEELVNLGLDVDEARDVLAKHLERKQNPVKTTEQKKEAIGTLDNMIKNAPYEQKAALKQMRQIILEETNVSELRKEITDLKGLVKMLSGRAMEERETQVNNQLTKLSEKYGKEVVDKHRETIVTIALRHPKESVRKIFFHEADEDLEQTILSKKDKETLTKDKRNAISSSGSGVSGATETIDHKNESFSSLIKKVSKLKR